MCMRGVKALARLDICTGSSEATPLAYAITTKITCVDLSHILEVCFYVRKHRG